MVVPNSTGTTYASELVTAGDVEYFSIESACLSVVQVLPVPNVTNIILWQSLSLDQFAYR